MPALLFIIKDPKLIAPPPTCIINCAAVPLKVTLRELCVKVPLFVKFPPIFKSPPFVVESAIEVVAGIVRLPFKHLKLELPTKVKPDEAFSKVTFCGTPAPVDAPVIHSKSAVNTDPVLYISVELIP